MRSAEIDPARLSSQDIGEGRTIQGSDLRRRTVTLTFDGVTPDEIARLLDTWTGNRPPMRSIQLTHVAKDDVNLFQARVIFELIEPAFSPPKENLR